jgi:hypothetical protein
MGEDGWRRRATDEMVQGRHGANVVSTVPGPVLNRFEGQIVTMKWEREGVAMVTKKGIAVADGFGYTVTISVPLNEQSVIASLARQARVTAAVVEATARR